MDIERTQGLAFLLSLAVVPIAGCGGDDDQSTATNASTETSTGGPSTDASSVTNTTSASGDSTGNTVGTTASSTDPGTDPSATGEATQGDSESSTSSSSSGPGEGSSGGSSESSGTTGADVDPLCAAYAAKYAECYPKYAGYEAYLAADCTLELGYFAGYSMACGMAHDDLLSCLGMADCDAFMAGTACTDEMSAEEMACGQDSGSSSGGGAGDGG